MKVIILQRVPFGKVLVNASKISMITPAASDPYHGTYNQHTYGCCLLLPGEEVRVQESAQQVLDLVYLAENEGAPPPASVLADPVPPLDVLLEGHVKTKKKGKK